MRGMADEVVRGGESGPATKRDGDWPNTDDAEVADLMRRAAKRTRSRYRRVLPTTTPLYKRRYGSGFRWVTTNGTVSSSFPSDRPLDAEMEAWWLTFCEDDHRARARKARQSGRTEAAR